MNAMVDTNGNALDKFRNQFSRMDKEIGAALPPHIPVERFMRVVLTAVNGNPDLQNADRRSLFESAMKAAQDGLLPDGRDGALVIFNTKVKRDGKEEWIKKVQWMPMVGGILKKVRNSGELLSIAAHVAYENDKFYYCLGDEERIEHEPLLSGDRGKPMLVYAVAKTKDGGIYREVMTIAQVEKVRNVSKAKDSGPWKDWWDEMARKTVIRRLAKRLPTSADLDDLLRSDDELYDFSGKRAEAPEGFQQVQNPLRDRVPAAAGAVIEHQPGETVDEDGVVTDNQSSESVKQTAQPDKPPRGNAQDASDPDVVVQDGDVTKNRNAEGSRKAAHAAPAEAAPQTKAAPELEQTASQSPATAHPDDCPYRDGPGYLEYMRDSFDSATSAAAVKSLWSSTRQDRVTMLEPGEIEALTKDRDAAIARVTAA